MALIDAFITAAGQSKPMDIGLCLVSYLPFQNQPITSAKIRDRYHLQTKECINPVVFHPNHKMPFEVYICSFLLMMRLFTGA
jgi:hypothetical protein